MKKILVTVLLISLLSAIVEMFLPWWSVALVAFAISFFAGQKPSVAFITGFVAVFTLWVGYAYFVSSNNNHLLAHKVALLLPMHGKVWALLIVTGLLGGLVSGFAALSGSLSAKFREINT